MARIVKDQECIFCGDTPCSCGGKKPAKRTKKKRPADEPKPEASKLIPQERQRDFTMEAAIRAVGPLLSRSDRAFYKRILGYHYSDGVERRLKIWRETHGVGRQNRKDVG